MVNLNANRNLTPDSTPWGKTIEKRLADLERENNLLKSDINNTSKGLSALSTRVAKGGLFHRNYSDAQVETIRTALANYSYPSSRPATTPTQYGNLSPLNVDTRTGNVVLLITLNYKGPGNVAPTLSAGDILGLTFKAEQEGNILYENTIDTSPGPQVYESLGTRLAFDMGSMSKAAGSMSLGASVKGSSGTVALTPGLFYTAFGNPPNAPAAGLILESLNILAWAN